MNTVVLEFKNIATALSSKDLELFAINEFRQLINERIFSFNKALDNSSFGTYRSESYKKKREDAGRQIRIKDLQFSGELANDLDIGEYKGKTALGFKSDRSDTIVEGQEKGSRTKSGKEVKQINKPIFSANQDEVDIVFEKLSLEIDRIIQDAGQGN